MSDPKTAADLEADAVEQHQSKEQAEYDAKPCCGKCGHHPGDSLHVCGKIDSTPEATVTFEAIPIGDPEAMAANMELQHEIQQSKTSILAPGGVLTAKEYEAAMEVEGLEPPSKQDLIAKVNEWMPNSTPGDKVAEAKRLLGRWMLLDLAYKAGLRIGRDLRERWRYGKGFGDWEELDPLSPRERGFVLGMVWDRVMPPNALKPAAFTGGKRVQA